MTWIAPVELEDVVYAAAQGVVGGAPLATRALVDAIVDRSKRYTSVLVGIAVHSLQSVYLFGVVVALVLK